MTPDPTAAAKLAKLEKFLQGELAFDDPDTANTFTDLESGQAGQRQMARYIARLIGFTPTKED